MRKMLPVSEKMLATFFGGLENESVCDPEQNGVSYDVVRFFVNF